MDTQLLPVLDTEALQKAATEYAMKGAIKSIEEYYAGYNSPFKKAIEESLKSKGVSFAMELPDILGLINDKLSAEIDSIANHAIASSFIPQVRKILTRQEPEVRFSDMLKQFVEHVKPDSFDDCDVTVDRNHAYGWLDVKIIHDKAVYELTLHEDKDSVKAGDPRYYLLSLPRQSEKSKYGSYRSSYEPKMKLMIEGATLEMPFSRDILQDNFISYCASMVIAKSKISMDTEEFNEDMFPHDCHCH